MLALRFPDGTDYPVKRQDNDDYHALIVTDPKTGKRVAHLKWSTFNSQIESVSVRKEYRRQGVATALLAHARTTEKVRHSATRTEAGDAWAHAVDKRVPKLA